MSSHLLWFRLPKGRVWHVAASGALVALCGQSIPARGERQPKRPPFGARPCPDCDNVAVEAATALGLAITSHKGPTPVVVVNPRQSGKSLQYAEWSADPEDLLTSAAVPKPEVPTALPVCEDCGHVFGNHDSLGVCQDVDENGDACECGEYILLCACEHTWALHDQDDGDCYYVFEEEPNGRQCACTEFRP